MTRLLFIVLMLFHLNAFAETKDVFAFPNAQQAQQFQGLLKQLRCLVCQNQDLADSNAPLANDLKGQIHDMISQQKSNEQIIDYLTARYGEFVLYSPPVVPRTYLLWFAPFLLLAIAMIALIATVLKRQPARN